MKKHLAIFSSKSIGAIFEGNKLIETRFSIRKIPPYGCVEVGDLIYIKPSGGDIMGKFIAQKVIYFQGLNKTDWQLISDHYKSWIDAGEEYFSIKKNSRYGTLIFIDQIEKFITSPIRVTKKDQRGWLVLG